ncbi:universal stress protein [Lysobacter pythonis]|uniref:Universal stress protein n=1 Tax=Solilutibacter pythonis TaxID=2483112 RepID=A0A3M2I0E3_9GAMM|nr:universal stress protein [Lysobacter pythonis]RMH93370.1 universal stress protein [Lysobacter pythonis]
MPASAQPDTPQAILLATDLSARTDRAYDRALQLAGHWRAKLVILVVLPQESSFSKPNHFQQDGEDEDAPTQAELIEERVRAQLPEGAAKVEVRVEESAHIGETVLRVARETGCGLIVTGIARSDALQRVALGSTVVWLSRHSTIPVLVVQQRPQGAYARIGVACDLSPAAAHALQLAAQWFNDAQTRLLLHGFDLPLRELSGESVAREAAVTRAEAETVRALTGWRDEQLPKAAAAQWQPRPALCNPVRLLRQASLDERLDLAVIASHGRGRLADALIGSVAKRLLETAITDTLIVRG